MTKIEHSFFKLLNELEETWILSFFPYNTKDYVRTMKNKNIGG